MGERERGAWREGRERVAMMGDLGHECLRRVGPCVAIENGSAEHWVDCFSSVHRDK